MFMGRSMLTYVLESHVLIHPRGPFALRAVEDPLHSEQLSEDLPGDLLQPGQQISSFSAPVKSPHPQLEGPTGGLI